MKLKKWIGKVREWGEEGLEVVTELTLYSAALSFYTIFAFVPILLLVLTIFSSTPFFSALYSKLEQFIASNILPSNQEVVLNYLRHFLRNSGKMGLTGGTYILVTSILFFGNYESIVTRIYPQPKRSLWERVKLYWTMLTLFPLLFLGALYLSVKVQLFLDKSHYTDWIHLTQLTPFVAIWGAFFFTYLVTISNRFSWGVLWASLIASAAFFTAKTVFVYYTFVNHTYKTLYGSISLLLFLFLWIYINWIIYLGGVYLMRWFEILERRREEGKIPPNFNYLMWP